jgi:hypothetical protein
MNSKFPNFENNFLSSPRRGGRRIVLSCLIGDVGAAQTAHNVVWLTRNTSEQAGLITSWFEKEIRYVPPCVTSCLLELAFSRKVQKVWSQAVHRRSQQKEGGKRYGHTPGTNCGALLSLKV